MPNYEPPEAGTLVIAAVLILALGFAGYWIILYVEQGSAPWGLARWFAIGVGLILALGLLFYWRRGSSKRDG